MAEFKEYKIVDKQEYRCSIHYTKGSDLGAYWLSVIPVKRTDYGTHSIEESGVFTGLRCNLLQANRRSDKRCLEAMEIARSKYDEIIKQIIKNKEDKCLLELVVK